MAFFKALSVALVLVQVLSLKAVPQAIVVGTQQFLDSGQEESKQISSPYLTVFGARKVFVDEYDDQNESDVTPYGSSSEEDQEYYYDYDDWYDYEDRNEDGSEEVEESEEFDYDRPLSRVRRRIIPVGKALDRDRPGERNPYGRGRSPWAAPPANNKGDSVVRRKGPTGSDALFSLYPDLAPPEWRAAHGYGSMDGQDQPSKPKKSTPAPKKKQRHITRETKRTPVKVVNNSRSYSKRKVKLSRDMKEEVAAYARIHGAAEASEHFSKKYRTPIKTVAVEKYLRRYKKKERRRREN